MSNQIIKNSYFSNNHPEIINKLINYYNQDYRHYHNWQHILDGFQLAEKMDYTFSISQEIAWLFHDVVYFPFNINTASSNEKLSANFLHSFFKSNYPEMALKMKIDIDSATDMIIGTTHHIPYNDETKILFDVDMSYLALPYHQFLLKRDSIRKEYQSFSDADFNKGTIEFYNKLLSMKNIYHSEYGIIHLELQCRHNITKHRDELLTIHNQLL